MQHRSLFVFDIETVPDTDAVPNLTGFTEPSVEARRAELERYHLEITDGRDSFPRQPFHRVVAISFLEAEIEHAGAQETYYLKELRSGGEAGFDEVQLLQGFFQYFEQLKPRLVSFNGRTFDLPVLKYRAMAHGIAAPWLYGAGDKWNSYMSRYAMDWHCDLLDVLRDYGASTAVKLSEVCAVMGFPGKFGAKGSEVAKMIDTDDIQKTFKMRLNEGPIIDDECLSVRKCVPTPISMTDGGEVKLSTATGSMLSSFARRKWPFLGRLYACSQLCPSA
mgnify:CR=1 FL=1